MLKLSLPLSGLLFCTSLSVFAAPVPVESLAGQTFIVKGEAFQAKLAITEDGLGRIWRPDGYSTLKWTAEGDVLVATLDTPLESPYQSADAQGNPVMGVTRLESLSFSFEEGQAIVADVTETYRDIFPAESGIPEAIQEYENLDLPFVNYTSLKPLTPAAGTVLALPLSGDQSAIIKVSDATQAILVEDPLNKAPATFGVSIADSLVLNLSETSSIRYTIIEDQGLSALLLAEVKAEGQESIFISAGGIVDEAVYQTPASAAEFTGTYTIPEFADTQYIFDANGVARVVATLPDGTVDEFVLTWGEQAGLIFGNRWTQMSADQVPTPVLDPAIALACQAGTASCEIAQTRTYKILAKTGDQLMVLRVLDQKVENGISSWIHVFNKVAR
ncbi:hypothetical protein [Oligoflexus tunisiensis]|uniref:hypothetical protein n=1 Tax=Oligoflexus tunisiensis TaxID=708132 RepID=UPI00114CDE19|nr:hypothetical protein [Oligoflexus tunisiensis]